MGARAAFKPMATLEIAKHHLRVGLEHPEKMDPADVSSLNELLDRIAALGVATDYDRIGLKPDQREIRSSPITHLVVVIEEQADNTFPPKLRTSYVWISESCEPDTHLQEETSCPLNIELGVEPEDRQDTLDPGSVTSQILQTPDAIMGQGSDFSPPTHHKQYYLSHPGPPDVCELMYVRQQPEETVHHFWARFLVKNKIKDCYDDDAVSIFCRNCMNEGILNALNRCCILHFADLAHIIQKYSAMESTWKAQTARWEPPAFKQPTGRTKRMHPYRAPDHHLMDKKIKPLTGHRTILDDLLDKPCQIHMAPNTEPTHSLRACWVLW